MKDSAGLMLAMIQMQIGVNNREMTVTIRKVL
jgi:hypothetical protein